LDLKHCLIFGYGQKVGGELIDQTRDRCDRGAKLWHSHRVILIHLTVSAVKDGVPMAEAMRQYLLKRGVPDHSIHLDPRGHNTAGEMDVFLNSRVTSAKPGFASPAIFVSTWYHIPRIKWLLFCRRAHKASVATAWKHAHWRADVMIEFLKLANAFLRPFKSSKFSP
jgi:uncharacterized SAM-binding protein YcdF (DUF218 family)